MGEALEALRSKIEQRKLTTEGIQKPERIWSIKVFHFARIAEAAAKLVEPAAATRVHVDADPTKIHIRFDDHLRGTQRKSGAEIVFTCERRGKVQSSQRPFRPTKGWNADRWHRSHDLGLVESLTEERFEEALARFFEWALWGEGCGGKPLI
jgi:hypothetical protein